MNSTLKVIGGAVLAAIAVGTALNFKALRRYLRMSTM
jgi:hypothetical protein